MAQLSRTGLRAMLRRDPDTEISEGLFAYALLAAPLLIVGLVFLYPLVYSFWLSLHRVDLFRRTTEFVGLGNYIEALRDPVLAVVIRNTAHFAGFTIVGTVVFGLGVALLLNESFFGRGFARTILMLPWSLSQVVLALLFGWIYNGSFGALNGLLLSLGLIDTYIGWLATGTRAMNLLVIAFLWHVIPLSALLFLSAIQTVPEDLYKSAKVDGANVFKRFWYVTLPWLRPTFSIVLVLSTLNGLLAFTLIYILTAGGPGRATMVLAYWGYDIAFQSLNLGTGAAIFYLLTLVASAFALLYARVFGNRDG